MSVSSPQDPNGPQRPMLSGSKKLIAAFSGTAVVAGVVAAGVAMPAVGLVASVTNTAIASFESFPTNLSDPVLPQRSVIQDANGKTMAYLYEQNRVSVPLSKISKWMQQAVIAIEDSRFYEHNGVDLRGTMRAFFTNQGSGSIQQGGSTITQQLVKMTLLNNAKTKEEQIAATERSPERKLREARYAIALEQRKTKAEILAGYLNIAYYGSGAYGVQVAAETYFRTSAAKLSLVQAATLAGAVNEPGAFDPIRHPEASQRRRDEVLARMRDLGYITTAQYQEAKAVSVKSMVHPRFISNGCPTSSSPYFCDYALNYIRNDDAFGATRRARIRLLETGGLNIRTTLTPQAQRSAQGSVNGHIPIGDPSHKAAAISMVEPGTGRVIAMAQNTKWGTDGIGKTTYNYNVRASDGGTIGFQSGSSFKPFTLASALTQGMSPYTSIYSPGIATFSGFQDCDGYSFGSWTVKNASIGEAGTFDMYSGTAMSVNTFFVGLEKMTGLCQQAQIAEALGVRRGDGEPLNVVPSFVLGANEVVPLDMAGAYAAFANDGVWCKPDPIERITRFDGEDVYTMTPRCTRVLRTDVARQLTTLLHGPVSGGGTAPNAYFGRDIAGKTGTTDSSAAVWFVGYSPQISAAVWVGDPRGGYKYPLSNVVINGSYYGTVYGATLPAPIWRQAMTGASEGMPYRSFSEGPVHDPSKYLTGGDTAIGGTGGADTAAANGIPSPTPSPTNTSGYDTDTLNDMDLDFGD